MRLTNDYHRERDKQRMQVRSIDAYTMGLDENMQVILIDGYPMAWDRKHASRFDRLPSHGMAWNKNYASEIVS